MSVAGGNDDPPAAAFFVPKRVAGAEHTASASGPDFGGHSAMDGLVGACVP